MLLKKTNIKISSREERQIQVTHESHSAEIIGTERVFV